MVFGKTLWALATSAAMTALMLANGATASAESHPEPDSAAAKAGTRSGNYELYNIRTQRCVTDANNEVLCLLCDRNTDHNWWIQTYPDGHVVLQSAKTHACLDDSAQDGLRTVECNGLVYQNLALEKASDCGATFRNHMTGKCLNDSFENGVRTFDCYYHDHRAIAQGRGKTRWPEPPSLTRTFAFCFSVCSECAAQLGNIW